MAVRQDKEIKFISQGVGNNGGTITQRSDERNKGIFQEDNDFDSKACTVEFSLGIPVVGTQQIIVNWHLLLRK